MGTTLNIRNQENAEMLADSHVKRFLQEFDKNWNAPNDKTAAAVVWSNLSDADKDKVRLSDPDLYSDMEDKYAKPI
jgi:hypothetical protein